MKFGGCCAYEFVFLILNLFDITRKIETDSLRPGGGGGGSKRFRDSAENF